MTGEGLGGFPFVQPIADCLVGDARGAGLKWQEDVQQPRVYSTAATEEGGACYIVGRHGEGAVAQVAVGEGEGGDEGGGLAGEAVGPKGDGGLRACFGAEGVA